MLRQNSSDDKTWEKEARLLQQIMFCRLGDREWDEWDSSNEIILFRKVGFGLYFLPENSPGSDNPTGYSKEQFKNIKRVADVILSCSMSGSIIHFGTIFIFGKIKKKRFNVPVFKVKGNKNQILFVDSDYRVYKNWQNYLDLNNLPKCKYCYPLDGLYQGNEGQVLVDFGTSPAYKNKRNFSIDNPATVVSFVSTSETVISSFIDFLGPFLEVAQETGVPVSTAKPKPKDTRVKFLVQSIENFVKSYLHDQSTESRDSKSWIRIVIYVLDFVLNTMREIIARSAAAGEVATELSLIYDNIKVISCSVNFLVTMGGILSLADEAEKLTLTPHDFYNFAVSLLFFSNTLLPTHEVKDIIENTQRQVMKDHCDALTEPQLEVLSSLWEGVQRETQLKRNANKIKMINHIKDKKSFYENLVIVKSDLEGHQIQFSSEEPGLININNELHIAPNKLVQISRKDRNLILGATQKVKESAMNNKEFRECIESISDNNRIRMEYMRREAISMLKQAFNTENLKTLKIGNVEIFKNMKPSELDRLAKVMPDSGNSMNPKILEIANEFAKMCLCETPRDYCGYLEFTVTYLNHLTRQKKKCYQTAKENANIDGKGSYKFDLEYGIKGKRAKHFKSEVIDSFSVNREESFKVLMQFYTNLENDVIALNENISPNFKSKVTATYHVFKHSYFGSTQLTAEEYFATASELVNEPLNQSTAQLNQQGDINIITFTNPVNGAKGIVYKTLADGKQSLATLFFDQKVLNQIIENKS